MESKNKTSVFIGITLLIICVYVFIWARCENRENQSIPGQVGSLIQEIRQIDNVLEQYGKDIRTGFDNLQTGIAELKGLTENNTGRIGRIEKGTGKAIGESESIIERLTGISETIGELRKSIESEGDIGVEFRNEIDSIRKELENIQSNDN